MQTVDATHPEHENMDRALTWWVQLQHLGPQHCVLSLECVAAPGEYGERHEQALRASRICQQAFEEAELTADPCSWVEGGTWRSMLSEV